MGIGSSLWFFSHYINLDIKSEDEKINLFICTDTTFQNVSSKMAKMIAMKTQISLMVEQLQMVQCWLLVLDYFPNSSYQACLFCGHIRILQTLIRCHHILLLVLMKGLLEDIKKTFGFLDVSYHVYLFSLAFEKAQHLLSKSFKFLPKERVIMYKHGKSTYWQNKIYSLQSNGQERKED